MLSGGWSNVTRQYVGERRVSRICLVFVAGEFWFFIFVSLSFLFRFCLAVVFSGLSSFSFVWRAHMGEFGDQIAARPYFVLRNLSIC